MPLITTSVPNLIQGVSQQPDATRHTGQCEEQENALSSVVDGLKKRPNTRHVARLLTTAIDENSFVHFIDRDDNEKYVVIHDGTDVRVFNILTGVEATINDAPAKKYTPSIGSYLDISNPRTSLKALTIADNTFLLNNQKVVEKSTSLTDTLKKEAWVYIKQGSYNSDYKIYIENAEGIQLNLEWIYHYYYDGDLSGDDPYVSTDLWYEENVYRLSIRSSADDYTPNTYIPYYKDEGDTTALGYIYIGDSGAAEGLSETDNGAVVDYIDYTNYYEQYHTPDIQINPEGVYISGSSSTFTYGTLTETTSDTAGEARSNEIARKLVLTAPSDLRKYFEITQYGNGILFEVKTQAEMDDEGNSHLRAVLDFSIRTEDSMSDTGIQAVYKSVPSITDLPLICKNGFIVKIIGDAELQQDDYYVKFETAGGEDVGQGAWVETAGYGIKNSVSAGTLPMRLINTGVDQFTLDASSWDFRKAGDDDTNPFPSFVGKKLNNLFLYKNRLGFLSQDHVFLTEAGNYFNLFRTTVTSLLDSDLIDVSVSSRRVTNLQSAIGFQENLILFSDSSQFAMKGGDLLTPRTVSITPITNFNFEAQVDPLPLGSYIYFPFTRGAFTGMREFTTNATSDTYDSVEITEHTPAYIPKNIIDMTGTTSEETLVLLSGDERGSLYIYNYFWNNNQKVLSAWSKFTFTGEIRGIEFIESTLYLVTVLNDETNLVELPFKTGTFDVDDFLVHLDMRVSRTVVAGTDSITIPYSVSSSDDLQVWTKDGAFLKSTSNLNSVQLSQTVEEDTEVWVGLPYTMKYTFSEQIFKAAAGRGQSPSNIAKLMLKNINLFYSDTAAFEVKVTPKFRETFTTVFTPNIVGESTIGTLTLSEGAFRVPVFTKAKDTTITIESDSALPCALQSAEFESFLHSRSNRIT